VALLGSAGGVTYAVCVMAAAFGTINAVTFTTARLIYVAAEERHLPSIFAVLHPKLLTPVRALVLLGILSSLMLIAGNLSGLILFGGLVEWNWYFVTFIHEPSLTFQLTVLGVFVLRSREPTLERYFIYLTSLT